jgi:hypothetical protein
VEKGEPLMFLRSFMLAIAVIACIVPDLAVAQGTRLTPLVVGWEQFFTITSETVQRGGGARVVGYVGNEAGFKAQRVRILVDGLDAQGQIVDQTIWWIGSPGPGPGGRVFFDAPAPAGARHRVSVFSYDWVQSATLDAP